jgi:glycosyltransferase involved in cell wall biosynthesis
MKRLLETAQALLHGSRPTPAVEMSTTCDPAFVSLTTEAGDVDKARNAERDGDFATAASHWADAVIAAKLDHPLYWSYYCEWLFALRTTNERRRHAPLTFDKRYAAAVRALVHFFSKSRIKLLSFERPAVFKGLDILADVDELTAIRNFVNAAQISSSDVELADKVLGIYYGDATVASHAWLVETNFLADKVDLYKFVIEPLLADASFHPIVRALKELEIECMLNQEAVSPTLLAERIAIVREGNWAPSEHVQTRTDESQIIRIPEMSVEVSTAVAISIRKPNLLFRLHERYSPNGLFNVLKNFEATRPRYQVITQLGYPMGGGESFMHQTCRILSELGFACVWTSFTDKAGKNYTSRSQVTTPFYLDIRLAGGMSDETVLHAVRDGGGWLIHSQGAANAVLQRIARYTRVPILVGYHFWTGLVELGSKGNYRIRNRVVEHALPDSTLQAPPRNVTRYVASEFMNKVLIDLGAPEGFKVIHPIPDPGHYLVKRENAGRTIAQINIAPLKGGTIFLECVRAIGDRYPFVAVQTEPGSEKHDDLIRQALGVNPDSEYKTFGDVRTVYKDARLVIVPSIVDETFCRVAFEAAMNGIPVISSRNGFLPLMLGDAGIYLSDDPKDWINQIEKLYHEVEALRAIGLKQQQRLQGEFGRFPRSFLSTILELLPRSLPFNIGLFGPWTNQGLGYQLRTYAKVLRDAGLGTHVFSFQPYAAKGRGLTIPENAADWLVPDNADTVYYSYNDRENVSINELSEFIRANNIGTLLVPEVCWTPNWDRLKQLSVPGLFLHAVPNIETVRKAEALEHNFLSSTQFNTKLSQHVLYALGVRNGRFIGHGYGEAQSDSTIQKKQGSVQARSCIRFVHIGGHNPISRKQTPRVLEAFSEALEFRNDISLTVTVMAGHALPEWGQLHRNIQIVQKTLTHSEILELYKGADVSIQVSSHEGLGLGFYESISVATPVITLDVAPYNEVVLPGRCGWHLTATPTSLPDNDDAVSFGASFDARALSDLLVRLTKHDVIEMTRTTALAHRELFDELAFLTRFVPAQF